MNKVYKSVWNESVGAWVAVSENSPARGKTSKNRISIGLASTSVAIGATMGILSPVNSFAQNVPYLGSESDGIDTCSRAGSNMQTCESWSPAFTAVSGSRLAYLTSLNGINEGGVWAGNLSSGMFYGSGPGGTNGVVIDSAGTTVSGAALTLRSSNGINVSSSKIINVAAGTQGTDAANIGQLTPLVSALGGQTAFNADGSVTGPKYSLKGSTYTNVGDALTALADSSGKYFHVNSSGADSVATGTNATAIGTQSVSSGLATR